MSAQTQNARRRFGVASLLAALALLGLFAASASATQLQRPFLERFGSTPETEFEQGESIGIDPTSGDVLIGTPNSAVFGQKSATFTRFHADGTPAPFAALGTNVIDGKGSLAGCSYPPTPSLDCDGTPQEGLTVGSNGPPDQIAVDPTNGNIYITQNLADAVDIFSAEGKYLGQLTQAGASLSNPCGVAVDPAGTVYVAQNRKISVFVPTGSWPVNADNTVNFRTPGRDPCHLALGSGPSAGWLFISSVESNVYRTLKMNTQTGAFSDFAEGFGTWLAVDPTNGNPIVFRAGSEERVEEGKNSLWEAVEFDGSPEVAAAPLSRLVVENPNLSGVRDFAVDATGRVHVALTIFGGPTSLPVYGQPAVVPTVGTDPASEVTSSAASLSGTVNPEGIAVTDCFFEYGPINVGGEYNWANTVPCDGATPPDANDHAVEATISGLTPNGTEYGFRLAARNENGTERSAARRLVTGSAAETKPATVTGLATATLNGLVHPEGHQYEECLFEWGLASNAGFEHTIPCAPGAGDIPPDTGEHSVSAELSGLTEATSYRFRLVAKNNGVAQEGSGLTFETNGPPQIEAIRASGATQDKATLEAEIDPRGLPASYRFEWGPTESYGHVAPVSFEPIGPGTSQTRVSVQISGLSPATTYHYRVVVSGEAGTTRTSDQKLQTLNSCDLPDGRCLELVSPREPGVALPLENIAGFQPVYQAAEASGGLAYEVELGFPGATYGGEILYIGSRGTSGWSSAQYNPSLAGPGTGGGVRYSILGLSPNLDCGVVVSKLPLTSDAVANQIIQAGGANLYRRNPDGAYTLITDRPPEELRGFGEIDNEFALVGMSDDCSRVVFESQHHYRGVPGTGTTRFYEWEAGTLRNVGWVPEGGGEVVAEASRGFEQNSYNAVSDDGSRVFFTATSKSGADSGNQAVFARIDGTTTLDVSQSSLATDTGATFQGATPDGSRVYFTADAGLTATSSSGGRDLYECRIVEAAGGEHECELTDLSANPGGVAEAGGSTGDQIGALVGLADDGSRVYFIARGQLVAGKGRSLAGNEEAGSYSLYAYEAASGGVGYVGAIGAGATLTNELGFVTTGRTREYTSRASADGRYLLFESTEDLTGYDSGDKPMAYLYDADAAGGARALTCVSCRQDGNATLNPYPLEAALSKRPLTAVGPTNPNYEAQSLAIRNGRPLVFFRSLDGLAPGGVEGEWGLYEWAHGQVFNIATDLPGATQGNGGAGTLKFLGASADGTDLYFVDSAALNWENPDARRSVWDARIGGGFEQPAPTFGCDPTAEGSCQAPAAPPPSVPSAATATFSGPGNVNEAGGDNNHCTVKARQAQRLSLRAKKLRRNARRVARGGRRARAVRLNRTARRLAKRARAQSKGAKRCRKRLRADHDRRTHR